MSRNRSTEVRQVTQSGLRQAEEQSRLPGGRPDKSRGTVSSHSPIFCGPVFLLQISVCRLREEAELKFKKKKHVLGVSELQFWGIQIQVANSNHVPPRNKHEGFLKTKGNALYMLLTRNFDLCWRQKINLS